MSCSKRKLGQLVTRASPAVRYPSASAITRSCVITCALFSAQTPLATAAPLTTIRVASDLNRPVYVVHSPRDFGRVFIVEQTGRIKILQGGTVLDPPFLDIESIVGFGGERGLLGLAFHPSYAGNGFFYVDYTNNSGNTVIGRYQVSGMPDAADPASELVLLTITQPDPNHNGGWIGFGPDGYLYIASGDGGPWFDPSNRAQDTTNELLGKILRIDVDGDDWPQDSARNYAIPPDNPFVGVEGDDEIWTYGLRNPWRCAFDSEIGDLYIADVGQDNWEEVNFVSANSAGGENYGWRCMEAERCTGLGGCTCSSPALTPPIHAYAHAGPGCISITGGEVYRGCAISELQGTYFFADYCSEKIWSFRFDGTQVTGFQERTSELDPGAGLDIRTISSFGSDAYGEVYICDRNDGEVFKIIPNTVGPLNDCDANGREDACEILDGTTLDENGNGTPDECEIVVPTSSVWGLVAMCLLLLAAGTIGVKCTRRGLR